MNDTQRAGLVLACFGDVATWLTLSTGAAAQSLPGPAVGTLDWRAFRAVAPLAECAVLMLPRPAPDRHMDELRVLLAAHRMLPLVVAAGQPLPPDVIRSLRPRGALLALPLEPAAVWVAAQHACTRALLHTAAEAFARNLDLDVRLRRALALAAAGPSALPSVGALAAAARCHRRTLWHAWCGTPLEVRGFALDDLLDWLVLFRGYLEHPGDDSWDATAARLGVHRHTLAHLTGRLAGVGLRHFAADAVRRARATFDSVVLAPLLAPPSAPGTGLCVPPGRYAASTRRTPPRCPVAPRARVCPAG